MALTKYSGSGEIYWNGRLLAEAHSLDYTLDSQNKEVNTFGKGLAGFSAGPEKVTINIETAIPKAGYEVDFFDVCHRKQEVRIVVNDAGKRRTFACWCDSVNPKRTVDGAAAASVKLTGKPVGSL